METIVTGPSRSTRTLSASVMASLPYEFLGRHSGAMRSIEPGISRFRVWSFGPSRNDRALLSRLRLHVGPIPRRRMLRRQPRPSGTEQLLAQRSLRIFALVTSALRQLRHQHIGDILEIAG